MKHVSTQTTRFVDVATATLEAAETEEAIGSTSESEPSQDPELQVMRPGISHMMLHVNHMTLHMGHAFRNYYTLSG